MSIRVQQHPQTVSPQRSVARSTILLVEDERGIIELVHYVLTQEGYEVVMAEGGDSALSVARNHRGRIDLLLTDVMMPGLRGDQLAERLLEVQPDLRILFISGQVANEGALRRGRLSRARFIRKPFEPHLLARRVRDMLAEPA